VLGPDVVVVEQARFLLGEDNDPSRSVGEALEQNEPPLKVSLLLILSAGRLASLAAAGGGSDVSGTFADCFRKLTGPVGSALALCLRLDARDHSHRPAVGVPNRPNRPLPGRLP
jgi:hypothetical protein